MNSLGLTLKVRLYPTDQQVREFEQVTKEYSRLCTLASKYAFEHDLLEVIYLKIKVYKRNYITIYIVSFVNNRF